MIRIAKGSKEYLPVKVTDVLDGLDTLDGTAPKFDVHRNDAAETSILSNQAADNQGMIALCLIDSTLAAFTEGDYMLYLEFDALPEQPRLGPMHFRVDD